MNIRNLNTGMHHRTDVEPPRGGVRLLRDAFLKGTLENIDRDRSLFSASGTDGSAFLIRKGIAQRSFSLRNGPPVILDLLIPGDIAGLEGLLPQHRYQTIVSTGNLSGYRLAADIMKELMTDPAIDRTVLQTIMEAAARMVRLNIALGRLDARERIASMVLDLYDRLRQRRLIRRTSFDLPLTQDEIGNHLGLTLEHVNRTLRRMREDHLLILDRGAVVLLDIRRLREMVQRWLPPLRAERQAGPSRELAAAN